MTQFPHDHFAKQYLEALLSEVGEVQVGREVPGEARQIDLWFSPTQSVQNPLENLGLLGKLATDPCLIEPYRNQPKADEIRSCLLKLFLVQADEQRKAKREQRQLNPQALPRLWILATTASQSLLQSFGGHPDPKFNLKGIYQFPANLRTGMIAINQLPCQPDTLWLRILGKGGKQRRAIAELLSLPADSPYRGSTLDLLVSWRISLELREDLGEDDREVFMNLSPAYYQRIEETLQRGVEQGLQQGLQQGSQREAYSLVFRLLTRRFGELPPTLKPQIEVLPTETLEALAEALLDFGNLTDLETWLAQH